MNKLITVIILIFFSCSPSFEGEREVVTNSWEVPKKQEVNSTNATMGDKTVEEFTLNIHKSMDFLRSQTYESSYVRSKKTKVYNYGTIYQVDFKSGKVLSVLVNNTTLKLKSMIEYKISEDWTEKYLSEKRYKYTTSLEPTLPSQEGSVNLHLIVQDGIIVKCILDSLVLTNKN